MAVETRRAELGFFLFPRPQEKSPVKTARFEACFGKNCQDEECKGWRREVGIGGFEGPSFVWVSEEEFCHGSTAFVLGAVVVQVRAWIDEHYEKGNRPRRHKGKKRGVGGNGFSSSVFSRTLWLIIFFVLRAVVPLWLNSGLGLTNTTERSTDDADGRR